MCVCVCVCVKGVVMLEQLCVWCVVFKSVRVRVVVKGVVVLA